MRHMTRFGALLLAGTLFAACGGEDRLTAAEFTEQANKICADNTAELEQLQTDIIGDAAAPTEEQFQEFFDAFVPVIQGQIDDIAELSPPEDIEADVDAMLESAQSSLDNVEETGPSVFTGSEDPFADANAKASELGLTDCAG